MLFLKDLRWYLFSKYQREAENLPPTFASLKYKIFRAHYVTMVLRRANVQMQMLPPASNYGWDDLDGQLIPIMTNNLPAPSALLEMSACACNSNCTSNRCKCRKNGFVFTDMCKCTKCLNTDDQNDDGEGSSDEYQTSDDDD